MINLFFKILLAFSLIWILSCKKDVDSSSESVQATVLVTLLDVERDFESSAKFAATAKLPTGSSLNLRKAANVEVASIHQEFSMPFSDDIAVFGTLEEVAQKTLNHIPTSHNSRKTTKKAAAERNPLPSGTRYLIAVYNASGQFLSQSTYIAGRESETVPFVLDGGSSYTFIGLSYNSPSTVPTIAYSNTGTGNLNTGSVTATTQDLMVFKRSLTLNGGNNTLSVILKHVFTEITTNLIIDPTIGGTITGISSAVMQPTRISATYSLGTEGISYGAVSSNGQPVTFPAVQSTGTKLLTSQPTLLRSPDITSGVLALRNLTINGTTKSEFLVPNLNVSPGKKYNLNLNFRVPCTREVNSSDFEARDGNFKDFTAPASDYGFVLDIYTLDNSFNMTINGTQLGSNEIQFQWGVSGFPRNIQFADGSIWGTNNVPEIYLMQGSQASPLIRITINPTGQVSLEGSKVANGPLFPLIPISGGNLTFNTINWNRTGNNNIRITQVATGATYATGRGRGKQIITCTN